MKTYRILISSYDFLNGPQSTIKVTVCNQVTENHDITHITEAINRVLESKPEQNFVIQTSYSVQ